MRPPTDLRDVTLAVLAGGAGSRMGRAKALLDVRGQPILEFLLDRLAWPGPTLLVTAEGRERPPGAHRFEREVSDPVADQGPLRGVLTALGHATTEMLVVAAIDMPGVRADDLRWYVEQLAARSEALAVMGTRGGQVEPLPCALRGDARELVSQRLAGGRRALHGLADGPRVQLIDATTLADRVWRNVNTPSDWEQFVGGLEK